MKSPSRGAAVVEIEKTDSLSKLPRFCYLVVKREWNVLVFVCVGKAWNTYQIVPKPMQPELGTGFDGCGWGEQSVTGEGVLRLIGLGWSNFAIRSFFRAVIWLGRGGGRCRKSDVVGSCSCFFFE
jgi:hypothetical protein